MQHARDTAAWLWLSFCVVIYGVVTTIAKKFINDNVGSLKLADLQARYAGWKLRRAQYSMAATVQPAAPVITEEKPTFLTRSWTDLERKRMARIAVRAICAVLALVIIARLMSLSGNKETKAQNETFILIILLLFTVFVGSGMLDSLLERAKEEGRASKPHLLN